ncbi:MAG: TonB-dependent receptor [Paludibacteraceae bacterium]|nr:TonB-dependent receptor [Paludibacteraceae bacterium]
MTNLVSDFRGCSKKIASFLSIGLWTIVPLFADEKIINDTIHLEEVVITATMTKVNLRNVPMSVSVVSAGQIKNRLQPSLLPLLSEEVPGLFITQRGVMGYGVAEGAAGIMNIRGIGGTPTTGVLILIDGNPQYMGLMGHPLADSYQSMMTERVEIVRGPASVLYGSNAMGGVINIITKKQHENGFHNSIQTQYGSYQTLSTELSSGWKKNRIHANAIVGYNRSDGHRKNMDAEQLNGYGKVGYDPSSNWSSFIDLNISNTKTSNPGTISLPINDNDADITRGMTSLVVENEYDRTAGSLKFFYNFGSHNINDGYANGTQPKMYRFHSNDYILGFTATQSYTFFYGNTTTAGFDYKQFGGKAWNKYLNKTDNVILADIKLNNIAGYMNIQQNVLNKRLTLNIGVRLDYHEVNGSEWIPQAGISFTPSTNTTLKTIVSKGYRNPTIREMYMFPPQNSDLKPERLNNYEISVLRTLLNNKINMGLNLYYIKGDNLIQVAMIDGKLRNVNTGKIENKGLEINANYQTTNYFRFSANYSLLNMTYKIRSAPEHKFYLSGNYTKNRWNVCSGIQYIGNLYTQISPHLVKESFILWNARINYQILKGLILFLRGENLLGQSYEIIAGYPMPDTTVFGGVQLHF